MSNPVMFSPVSAYNIVNFGAIPNDAGAAARAANTDAFRFAQQAMDQGSLGVGLFVPAGTFHLDGDVVVTRSLELFGAGVQGESILRFDQGKSLIVDVETAPVFRSGENCVIRDLQILSAHEWTFDADTPVDLNNFEGGSLLGRSLGTPGIKLNATAIIQRVYIAGFTGTGIEIIADSGLGTNANTWRVHDVYINMCGGHGIHADGSDANDGFCSGIKVIAVGGSGIYEGSQAGGAYVGCSVEVAKGRGYQTDSDVASFFGCYAEGAEPSEFLRNGTVFIGGNHGGLTDNPPAFLCFGFDVGPFELRNPQNVELKLYAGFRADPTVLFGWREKAGGDFWTLRWDEAKHTWSTENGLAAIGTSVANYLTGSDHARGAWLQGFPSMLLGPPEATTKITTTATLSEPLPPFSGPWRHGDIVYNSNPEPGQYIGWVWIATISEWRGFGRIEP